MPTKIFFIGATGYIGGTTLARILKHPQRPDFEITVLLRSQSKVKGFESLGLKTVIGSLSDLDILERLSSESDVVFQSAHSEAIIGTKAILKGLKQRFDCTGIASSFIHTSGTAVLADDALGMFATENICSDLDVSKIEAIPITQEHREVDVAIVGAGKQGYVKTFIVMPSTVWGIASTELTEMGLQNQSSRQIPTYIDISVKRHQTILVGEGKNIWCHIEVGEMGDFYYMLFDSIISEKNPAYSSEGYYFVENGEYTQGQVATAVGCALLEFGKVDAKEPMSLTNEELEHYPKARFLGTNARARGDRSRRLGWRPAKATEELLANVGPEVDNWLKHTGRGISLSQVLLWPWTLVRHFFAGS